MKYVMSDIHGYYDRYIEMKEKIKLSENDKLIIVGDVIDRGPDGIKILQDIMATDNIMMMVGNHELMMFESDMLDRGVIKDEKTLDETRRNWIETNGGYTTMRAFCSLNDGDKNALIDWIQEMINTPPLRLAKLDDGRIFALCHGWPSDPSKVDQRYPYNYVWHNVWDRPDSRNQMPVINSLMKEKNIERLIIGHTPVNNLYTLNEHREYKNTHPRILHAPGFIDIDCGSGHGAGCLGCLCLDTMEEFYVK